MEGRDALFSDMLESISQKVESEEKNEATKNTQDPLKTKSPKELKGDGKKDMKLQKMGKESKETKTEEGIDPTSDKKGDYGQDEAEKIKKLTEGEDVAEDVKSLITKAKEALDSGDYAAAQDLVSRLSQVKAAVSEPEDVEPGNTGMGMPAVDMDDEMEESTEDEKTEELEEDYSEFIMDDKIQEMIDTALDSDIEFKLDEAKKDPKAKLRNRGDVIFPAESPKVKDDKDHFPINSEKQARNALARANQYKSSPKWYDGSLKALVTKVANAVKKKYKGIEVSKEAKTPGKG